MAKSIKGQNVDMQRLSAENKTTVALGNMNVNAAGDTVSRNGQVTETAGQKAKFFYKTVATTVTENVSLKSETESAPVTLNTSKAPKKAKEVIEDNGDIVVNKE